MKILLITQKVDMNDSVLGFFHRWVAEFAKNFEQVTVICLEKGQHDLPKDVKVLSLGKEQRKGGGAIISRLSYLCRFYKYIWQEQKNYDVVFVHMNQEYVLLGWKLWWLLGKKIYLWRNHKKGNVLTNLAVFLSSKVFCTSAGSYTAQFKKTQLMPVGVDSDAFKKMSDVSKIPNSILFLSRISPVKHADVLVRALNILHKNGQQFVAYFYGGPTPVDRAYFEKVKAEALELVKAGRVIFEDEVPNTKTPAVYNAHEISVNLTDSGSFDKTIIEAMLCETIAVASNESLSDLLDPRCMFADKDAGDLAKKLAAVLALSPAEKESLGAQARVAAEKHSLEHLMEKLTAIISPVISS